MFALLSGRAAKIANRSCSIWPAYRNYRYARLPRVVRHGYNGFLVPVGGAYKLAKFLKQLIQDPELRDRMGARGARLAAEEFSSDRVIAETLSLYGKLPPVRQDKRPISR